MNSSNFVLRRIWRACMFLFLCGAANSILRTYFWKTKWRYFFFAELCTYENTRCIKVLEFFQLCPEKDLHVSFFLCGAANSILRTNFWTKKVKEASGWTLHWWEYKMHKSPWILPALSWEGSGAHACFFFSAAPLIASLIIPQDLTRQGSLCGVKCSFWFRRRLIHYQRAQKIRIPALGTARVHWSARQMSFNRISANRFATCIWFFSG